jgi:hypothetical protein
VSCWAQGSLDVGRAVRLLTRPDPLPISYFFYMNRSSDRPESFQRRSLSGRCSMQVFAMFIIHVVRQGLTNVPAGSTISTLLRSAISRKSVLLPHTSERQTHGPTLRLRAFQSNLAELCDTESNLVQK